MRVLASFRKAEIARFYIRFVLMVLCLACISYLTVFSNYGKTGTYRFMLWAVLPAAAYYPVAYARSLYHLHRGGNAMLWEQSTWLYWLTDTLNKSPLSSFRGAQAEGETLRLTFESGQVTLMAKLAREDLADIVRKVSAL